MSDMGRFLSVGMWVMRAARKSDGAAEFGFAARGTRLGWRRWRVWEVVSTCRVDQWCRRRGRFPVAVGDHAVEFGGGEPVDTDMCVRGVGQGASGVMFAEFAGRDEPSEDRGTEHGAFRARSTALARAGFGSRMTAVGSAGGALS